MAEFISLGVACYFAVSSYFLVDAMTAIRIGAEAEGEEVDEHKLVVASLIIGLLWPIAMLLTNTD